MQAGLGPLNSDNRLTSGDQISCLRQSCAAGSTLLRRDAQQPQVPRPSSRRQLVRNMHMQSSNDNHKSEASTCTSDRDSFLLETEQHPRRGAFATGTWKRVYPRLSTKNIAPQPTLSQRLSAQKWYDKANRKPTSTAAKVDHRGLHTGTNRPRFPASDPTRGCIKMWFLEQSGPAEAPTPR